VPWSEAPTGRADVSSFPLISSFGFPALVIARVAGARLATPAPSRSLDDDRSGPATLDPAVTPDPPTTAGTWGSESPGAVTKFLSLTFIGSFKRMPLPRILPTARGFLVGVAFTYVRLQALAGGPDLFDQLR